MEPEALDYYRVLQVDAHADVEVIQAAYRVLARRFHPDLAGDDSVMKRINAAWEVLGDKERRRAYDERRSPNGSSPSAGGAAPSAGSTGSTIFSGGPSRPTSPDHAGPPVGHAFGTVLTYGRYEGWSLGQIALADPDFLEWLRSVPGGRYLRPEIDAILKEVSGPLAGDNRWRAAGASARRFEKAGVVIG
jgi:curved DNA-binding protein CbpA